MTPFFESTKCLSPREPFRMFKENSDTYFSWLWHHFQFGYFRKPILDFYDILFKLGFFGNRSRNEKVFSHTLSGTNSVFLLIWVFDNTSPVSEKTFGFLIARKRYSRIPLECSIEDSRKPFGFRTFGNRKRIFRNAFTVRKPSRKRKRVSVWVSEPLSVF